MELTLELIQALSKLVVDHKLDRLKLGDLEILKTKHEVAKSDRPAVPNLASMSGEELLFYSTTAPALTVEEVEQLAVNPPPRKKAKAQ